MKVIEKIHQKEENNEVFYSYEFFPPRTPAGAENLVSRLDRMGLSNPLCVDITWGAGGGDPGGTGACSSMTIAATCVNLCGMDTMLHMTCAGQTKDEITGYLQTAKENGIENILALRGDPLPGQEFEAIEDGFSYGVDLVRHIRQEFGDYFGICVAGYPSGHPNCTNYQDDLKHLKEKVDAGADLIITQLFFESQTFIDFFNDCRNIGIDCPIIPGILPIQGFNSLRHLTKLSQLTVPQHIIDAIEPIKDDDAAVREYGVCLATTMCKELIDAGVATGFHFYTLNREVATLEIVRRLGLFDFENRRRSLPWKPCSANESRSSEEVRPIFWATRPRSYLSRTQKWDDFPNGRWGDSSSPAYGELTDYHLFMHTKGTQKELKKQWGEKLDSIDDVSKVFVKYLKCDGVTSLPWNEDALSLESGQILDKLATVNGKGVFTINSQPAVNGAPSTDASFGWGGDGGYVYQKAYLEFFAPKDVLDAILANVDQFPSITFHAINKGGVYEMTNSPPRSNAVTWGVFPNKEIIQPTVVDAVSFRTWKDEAFGLWAKWSDLYEKESSSRKIIDDIVENYYLVNLVDNDFINGDIFRIFECIWGDLLVR